MNAFELSMNGTTTRATLEALQPVFILGTPKSGTSFLYSLFDSHPSVVTLYETGVYGLRSISSDSEPIISLIDDWPAKRYASIHRALTREQVTLSISQNSAFENSWSSQKSLLSVFLSIALDNIGTELARRVTHFVEILNFLN